MLCIIGFKELAVFNFRLIENGSRKKTGHRTRNSLALCFINVYRRKHFTLGIYELSGHERKFIPQRINEMRSSPLVRLMTSKI